MSATFERILDLHHEIAELAKEALGKDTIIVTCISMNARDGGQWVMCHPDYDKAEVAKRMGICAGVLTA
jgi:hypothetical protein